MKRYIIWCFISCTIFFTACDSLLDVEPENAATFTNFFKTEQDLEALTIGMHAWLSDALGKYYAQEYTGIMTDETPWSGPEISIRNNHSWNQAANWSDFYAIIYQCNLLFDNVKTEVCKEDRMKFYFGQAKFIKGLCYFELGRRWGDAVITGNTEEAPERAKSPATEVLDTALANAIAAYDLLPIREDLVDRMGKSITCRQYGSKGTAATLIANIYAWRAVIDKGISETQRQEYWSESEKWASKVIDTDECGVYELESSIADLVMNTINKRGGKESIFEIEMNTDDGSLPTTAFVSAKYFVRYPIIPGDLPNDEANWKFSNDRVLAMYPGNDERRQEYFYKFDAYSRPDSVEKYKNNAYVYKYRECAYSTGTGAGQTLQVVNFDVNRIYWRLADLILLRAEARCHQGNTSGAISDLDRIRGRANATLYEDAPEADLQKAIYKEREKELLFEDQRFWDIMRNDYINEELPEYYSTLSEDDISNGALYLPVPDGAFYLNPLMLQNVYWLNKL